LCGSVPQVVVEHRWNGCMLNGELANVPLCSVPAF
jgi:hypothetical protein